MFIQAVTPLVNIPKESFRNNSNVRYLKGLFFETLREDKSSCVYTLKDVDHNGYPSLYLLYMHCGDLTEWNFSQWYLDGWEHWENLCECSWFKPYVERWRKEIELKYRSQALSNILIDSSTSSKTAMQSNKFIVDAGWKPKEDKRKVGRTTKEEIKRRALVLTKEKDEVNDDFKRIVN